MTTATLAPSLLPLCPPAPHHLPLGHAALRSLKPVEMLPEWRSRGSCVPPSMRSIDRIAVRKTDGQCSLTQNPIYALEIFYEQPTSRIPTIMHRKQPSRKAMGAVPHRGPDMAVTRTFAQFMALRNSLHSCVESGHAASSCDFCGSLNRYMRLGGGRSMAFVMAAFDSTNDASSELAAFFSWVLEECQVITDARELGRCRGLRHVPHLLYAFIYASTND